MKTKEQLADEYEKDNPGWYDLTTQAWLAGFETAQPKWINVEENLPEDDRCVTAYLENLENPLYNGLKICNYIDGKWYCRGGRNSQEEVIRWTEIPQ